MSDSRSVQENVREVYDQVAGEAHGTGVAAHLYGQEELRWLPGDALCLALGLGNPTRWASLCAGERVLDLGCGAGIDSLLAARVVGQGGRVFGLDMTPAMLERAETNARVLNLQNIEFLSGQIEAVPLPGEHVDAVISNGVINLCPEKKKVFSEAMRLLRPGGRLVFSDMVVAEDLPKEIREDPAAWSG
ncbi:MAG: methyltransferase domain-containing protein [Armatimonadetes bacterium]|nr:methyltransferase domain-containing protein [Armatimonadota bacterium]